MNVDRITATIRYSQDTGKGAWKVIEVGAEGTIEDQEKWQQAQAQLYAELSAQLKELWTGSRAAEAEPSPIQAAKEHWCEEHESEFTKKTSKDGGEWWSHKTANGKWCRE